MKRKCDLSNPLFVISFALRIKTLIWHCINSLLKNILKVNFELSNLTDGVFRIEVLCFPSIITRTAKMKLSWVVSCCNSFCVPFYTFVLLNWKNIIEKYNCKQVNKHPQTAYKKSENLSVLNLFFRNQTGHLNIHHSLVVARVVRVQSIFDFSWSILDIPVFSAYWATLHALALLNNSFVHFYLINITGASLCGLYVIRIFPNALLSAIHFWLYLCIHNT